MMLDYLVIPLDHYKRKMYMWIIYPTDDEMKHFDIYEVTSSLIYYPRGQR